MYCCTGSRSTMRTHRGPPCYRPIAVLAATTAASLLVHVVHALPPPPNMGRDLATALIWHPNYVQGSYIAFRREFVTPTTANTTSSATLHLFADSRYILWFNGAYITRGPVRFDPQGPTFDSIGGLPLAPPGQPNLIAILGHNYATCGDWQAPQRLITICDNPAGRFMNHYPGVTAILEDGSGAEILRTDSHWTAWNATRYAIAEASWGSISDVIDGRADDFSWTTSMGPPRRGVWDNATAIQNSWGPLTPRTLPFLREKPWAPTIINVSGGAGCNAGPGPYAFPLVLSAGCHSAQLAIGSEAQAYVATSLTASAPGVSLTINVGERYVAGDCAQVTGTVTYTAAGSPAGESLLSSDTFGGRYVCISFKDGGVAGASLSINNFSVVERQYPYTATGTFSAGGDPFLEKLFVRSLRTVQVTSEDAYVDCAGEWRNTSEEAV